MTHQALKDLVADLAVLKKRVILYFKEKVML